MRKRQLNLLGNIPKKLKTDFEVIKNKILLSRSTEEDVEVDLLFGSIYGINMKESRKAGKEICHRLAEKGNLVALGLKMMLGYDCMKQDTLSFSYFNEYFHKTLNSEISASRIQLGYCMDLLGYFHQLGTTVEKDINKAVWYYKQAAELHNVMALSDLAFLYEFGLGVPKDAQKSFELYSKSAEMGFCQAIENLARYYKDGISVQKNHELSATYYLKLINFFGDDKSDELKLLISLGNLEWKADLHPFWELSDHLRDKIFLLIMICKYRRHSKMLSCSFLVKPIALKIIKLLVDDHTSEKRRNTQQTIAKPKTKTLRIRLM